MDAVSRFARGRSAKVVEHYRDQIARQMVAWPKTIYVDVDGTLVLWSQQRPGKAWTDWPRVNAGLCGRLRKVKEAGYDIVIWSRGGILHARWAACFCGIDDIVTSYAAKPHLMIDDSFKWLDSPKTAREMPDGKIV